VPRIDHIETGRTKQLRNRRGVVDGVRQRRAISVCGIADDQRDAPVGLAGAEDDEHERTDDCHHVAKRLLHRRLRRCLHLISRNDQPFGSTVAMASSRMRPAAAHRRSCSVWVPGDSVIFASVCPAPKCK